MPADVSSLAASVATVADRPEIHALRHRVFVDEQGVPAELERDELDEVAVHAVARDASGQVVGAGRVVAEADGAARIGRMAVASAARGEGVGAALLAVLEAAAAGAGCTKVTVHAQTRAAGFYHRAGYATVGPPFEEAGIAHVAMAKALS